MKNDVEIAVLEVLKPLFAQVPNVNRSSRQKMQYVRKTIAAVDNTRLKHHESKPSPFRSIDTPPGPAPFAPEPQVTPKTEFPPQGAAF